MSRARFAFPARPETLADLRTAPGPIRDLSLLELQHLVHGNERGAALERELAGCHKVYVDPETQWRMVIQYRDALASSQQNREIYLLSVGARQDHAAYNALHRQHQHRQSGLQARRAHAAGPARSTPQAAAPNLPHRRRRRPPRSSVRAACADQLP